MMKTTLKNTFRILLIMLSAVTVNTSYAQDVAQVGPIKAKLMVRNGGLMIDVRENGEVKELAYDVENLVNIPLSEFESRLTEIPKDQKLVMVCASGNRSQKAATILIAHGYTDVVNMTGGIAFWQEKNLEVKTNGTSTKKACCANPNSKDCNPDGSCKTPKSSATKKACCAGSTGKACDSSTSNTK